MTHSLRAYGVHLFTAIGAVMAMLAILEAAKTNWDMMFLWLMIAFIVDGIDGPLARKFHVKSDAQLINGDLLDLIIDYLTYVFIPAFALFQSGLLSGWTGWFSTLVITYASVLYFSDTRMKNADQSFSGFPSCWNMVILVLFAIKPHFWIITAICVTLAVLMFSPLKFIHPIRTKQWRIISLPIMTAWIALAINATINNFALDNLTYWGILITSLYLLLAGVVQSLLPHSAKTS